jgi:hypothetical protein
MNRPQKQYILMILYGSIRILSIFTEFKNNSTTYIQNFTLFVKNAHSNKSTHNVQEWLKNIFFKPLSFLPIMHTIKQHRGLKISMHM